MTEKWALITGATAGIGWATAEALAQAHYNLILIGRREDKLQELKKTLSRQNPASQVKTFTLDISKKEKVSQFILDQADLLKQVDVLVNNAGLAKGTEKMQEARIDDWDVMIDTNIKGLLYMTRGVLQHMAPRKTGHIVNLGSVAGRFTYPGGAVYSATKFAVRALSDSLRMDLMGTQIRVTNIAPGMVQSEFSVVRLEDQQKADQVYAGMTPLKPEDIAETILWCLSRPPHVNVQEMIIYPTDQAGVGPSYVSRKS